MFPDSYPSGVKEIPPLHPLSSSALEHGNVFDLLAVPHAFIPGFKVVPSLAHRRDFHLLQYLNDWLVNAHSLSHLALHQDQLLQLC